ncbi:DNA-processing protein DprA [Demequina gelatinilytica]|uniref:DNA-processing protein DprA n=1 Tax=Demequina gelatinilytica TaxID=1638980 RepID=UPI0007810C43|nr:DNA-processing protein DprA [Demequina gelatinilytica]
MTSEADAAVAWSALAEPCDAAALALIRVLGHAGALVWVREAAEDLTAAAFELASVPETARRVMPACERWIARLGIAEPDALRARASRVGARAITRGEPGWPARLADLEDAEPHALWVRGSIDLDVAWSASVAIVGARAATAYGAHISAELAAVAAEAGLAVISGGAYGIDAAAHRGALGAGGVTVAVLAGGVDRLYPAGNAPLLERIAATGAVVSELPPGFAPHRSRFLRRNRLIAAARATVVVEAGLRSGALSTAREARELVRPLGVVPGPMTSASSAGCHALVRDHPESVVVLGSPSHVLELARPIGEAPEPDLPRGGPDFGSEHERQAYGAIPLRGASAAVIAIAAGLTGKEATEALAALRGRGLATVAAGVWNRADHPDPPDKPDNTRQSRSEF